MAGDHIQQSPFDASSGWTPTSDEVLQDRVPGSLLLLLPAALAGEVFLDTPAALALVEAGAAVLDARGRAAWREGHVPGSWPIDWLDHREGRLRTGLLTEDLAALDRALEAAGVDDDRPVLVVGAGPDGWGEEGRIFWMLEYLGHPQVRLLDGGWPRWTAASAPTTTDRTLPSPGDFTPRPQHDRRALLDEVVAATHTGSAVLWDTREDREYAGSTPYGERRGGHVPGAIGLWYGELTGPDGRLLPREVLLAKLSEAGLSPDRAVVPYCTGGVRSGFAYAVLRDLGYPHVANYDGSMWEWAADPALPLTTARSTR